MGLTKKEKERMKKMTEERWRKSEKKKQHEARKERGTGDAVPVARLGAALRHQPADMASATPPPPPLPTTSPQQTSNPTSRSIRK